MVRFERSREGKRRDSRDASPRKEARFKDFVERPRGRPRFEERPRGRDRGFSGGRDRDSRRGPLELTKVVCGQCGINTEVPFKPTSNKPVLCRDCFTKAPRSGPRGAPSAPPSRELELINMKLDKIMKAL
ncbi:MAG: hypothetical protein QGG83_06195, partial [Candidatus Woesearchaeota archaeon]|nr:hypothetical protein [Candidatus Woesearchaeota archaeon]